MCSETAQKGAEASSFAQAPGKFKPGRTVGCNERCGQGGQM